MIKRLTPNIVLIKNHSTSLIIQLDSIARILYFGKNKQNLLKKIEIIDKFNKHASSDVLDKNDMIFSSWCDGADLEPMVKVEDSLGNYVNRFHVDSFKLIYQYDHNFEGPYSRNKEKTIRISYLDETKKILVEQLISTHKDSDALVFSLKITNRSSKTLKVTKAMSAQLDFPSTDNTLYSLDGTWGRERNLTQTEVKTGIFGVKSSSGYSSNIHNPFVIVRNGETYVASNLIYSGSHAETIEALPIGKSRFLSGINSDVFSWTLNPQESFATPEAVICYGESVDEVSQKMHTFVKNDIIRPEFLKMQPRVLLNSWEGIFFDFNRPKILELSRIAKSIGVDLFVLDDGWFGKRDDDTSSLGDWYDYSTKTGGLKSLVDEIKALGLGFGLWFEPEMVSKNSDLFRKHPNYAMAIPGVKPIERRHQLMLDFARKEVRDYVFKAMCKVIDDIAPDYLKLDANRVMSDIYSVGLKNHGEYQHRYMLGLFDFWQRLTEKFPQILVEACSSGGNRFDLGTLFYFPQIWASDNSDAQSRIFIQEGTLLGYPQLTMGAHVSHVPNNTTNKTTPLESRFNVASDGAFGYELDLTKLPKEELDVMKKQIGFYHEWGTLLRTGVYRRLKSAYSSNVYSYLISDSEEDFNKAILFVSVVQDLHKNESVKIRYLDPNAMYRISYRSQENLVPVPSKIVSGAEFMRWPMDLTNLFKEERNVSNDTIASRLVIIEKVI